MSVRKSPLHAEHVRCGGRLVDFHGWELPVQFAGLVQEHTAVRQAAGIFDVSHMAELHVEGAGATAALDRLLTNRISKMSVGQAQYNAMLRPHGGIVDDLVAYRRGEERWLLVVNASNRDKDRAWVQEQLPAGLSVADHSDSTAQIALQGPRSQEILGRLCDLDLAAIGYYHFAEGDVLGAAALVSRTGYTGEDGFEIYLPNESAPALWRALLEVGEPLGLVPAGLGARDSLRLEMKFALYGNDIDETTHPLEAGLGWIVKLKKGDFIGRDALLEAKSAGLKRHLVGIELQGRNIARAGYDVLSEGAVVGKVTSGTFSPTLQKPVAMAYVPAGLHEVGSTLEVDIRGRAARAVVVETPFYRRPDAAA